MVFLIVLLDNISKNSRKGINALNSNKATGYVLRKKGPYLKVN